MNNINTEQNQNKKIVSPWMVLLTVIVGTLLIGLDRTVVGLALPKIINEFGLTISLATWISTSYILSNAIFVPVFGKLGDMYGNKKIYFYSFIGFIVISLLAGFAWSFGSLVFFRILQGLVGAAVYPTAMSLIVKNFHDMKQRASALGIWSASMAASAAFGPLIGGYLIDNYSWRSVFYINLPIGFIGLIMVLLYIENDEPVSVKEEFDYIGSILMSVFISSIVLVLDKGQDWGWSSKESLICYALFVIFSIWFYLHEKRVKNPMIDFKFFKDRNFTMILLISFISFGAMMGSMFLLPLFLQIILGYDATHTGYVFLPMALAMIFSAPLGASLAHKYDMRVPVITGIILGTIGLYLFSITLNSTTTLLQISIPFVIFAIGIGLLMAPLTNGITALVPRHEVGIASGILNLTRNIAGAFGIAIFSTYLTHVAKINLHDIGTNTLIHTTNPQLLPFIPALVMMKAQILSYATVFRLGALIMFLAFFAAITLKIHLSKKKKGDEDFVMISE